MSAGGLMYGFWIGKAGIFVDIEIESESECRICWDRELGKMGVERRPKARGGRMEGQARGGRS